MVEPISPLNIGGAAVTRPTYTFNPRISLDQAFTDNARGSPPGQRHYDLYTTVTPGALLDVSTAHHRFTVDYSYLKRYYVYEDDLNRSEHNLAAYSQSELVDGIFFIDTQFSMQDATLNSQGQVSADPTVRLEGNSATVLTASGSPFLRYQLDKYVDFETRYRYGVTKSLTQGAQDSESHRFTQTAASGREFDDVLWGVTLDGGWTDYTGTATFGPSGDRTDKNFLSVASVEVPIVRQFSLAMSLGYETIEDQTLTDQPNGAIWSVGFRYRPGPRTTLQMAYGDRYDKRRVSGGLSYIISPRSSLTISYGNQVRQTGPTANNTAAFLAPDGFGNLVDVRTGQGLSFSDSLFGLTSSSFFTQRFDATFFWGHDKGSSTFTIFQESRSGSTTQSDQDAMGFTYGYSRSLNSYLSMGFNASIAKTETTGTTTATTAGTAINVNTAQAPGTKTEIVTTQAGGSLNYQISDTMTGTVAYSFLLRDSNSPGGDLRENLLTVGVRKSF